MQVSLGYLRSVALLHCPEITVTTKCVLTCGLWVCLHKQGQFVSEYVGDLVDEAECKRRLQLAHANNVTNFYMLTLDKNRQAPHLFTLRCSIVIGPVCGWVCGCVCLFVGLLPR